MFPLYIDGDMSLSRKKPMFCMGFKLLILNLYTFYNTRLSNIFSISSSGDCSVKLSSPGGGIKIIFIL